MVEYWIETGRECFNIGNFNSLMAIISGLNMSPISRLKKTVSNTLFFIEYYWNQNDYYFMFLAKTKFYTTKYWQYTYMHLNSVFNFQ